MKKEIFNNWSISFFVEQFDYKNIINIIENKEEKQYKVLKDNKRSLVLLVEDNNKKIILKNPRDKNNNRWIKQML